MLISQPSNQDIVVDIKGGVRFCDDTFAFLCVLVNVWWIANVK